jgi:hypothetical protein
MKSYIHQAHPVYILQLRVQKTPDTPLNPQNLII